MEDLWPVEVDQGQISQVISNLAINADQAMPEGGVIKVSAENITLRQGQIVTLQTWCRIRAWWNSGQASKLLMVEFAW
jgi:signal transduction histidine kinase